MKYITYCPACEKITGHQTHGLISHCQKCNREIKTPVLRWIALIFIIAGLSGLGIYIIYTSIKIIFNV